MVSDNFCLQCRKDTGVILDHQAGEKKFCSECGWLFLEPGQIDSILDWEILSDSTEGEEEEEEEKKDPNPVFETCDIPEPRNKIVKKPRRGYRLIGMMAERLGLVSEIKDRCFEIYNRVKILKTCRGRSLNSILAACLFIACRELKLPRTLKELSDVADGVKKKDINRAIECIKKQLEVETGTVQPGELVKRICSKLGMDKEAIMAVQETLKRTDELDIRRSPKSVLSAIIYIVIQLSQDEVSVKDIANATEVTELTVRKSYRDISQYASRLIPNWYATEEDIMKIPTP